MGEGNAWVTLATNDSYSLGALVLAHSLRRAQTAHPMVILVTPGVSPIMKERLSHVFAEVVHVDVMDSGDAAHLALLARPELGITFTKLHCWTLTRYSKCVFLDADTLVLQNCDELFEREELSAAPDVGWPDCFNSGVFVYRPSNETFASLIQFAKDNGSFDGGDQGLLNQYFSTWATGDISRHLSFLYNVCSTSFYSYLPALKQYGQNMKIVHFIGQAKPWLETFNWSSRTVEVSGTLQAPLQHWWDIFIEHVHPVLDAAMGGHILEAASPALYTPPDIPLFPWHRPITPPPSPEHHYNTATLQSEFVDPWEIYVPPPQHIHEEVGQQHYYHDSHSDYIETQSDVCFHQDTSSQHVENHMEEDTIISLYQNKAWYEYHTNEPEYKDDDVSQIVNADTVMSLRGDADSICGPGGSHCGTEYNDPCSQTDINSICQDDWHEHECHEESDDDEMMTIIDEDVRPRHPYDNFYLRHQVVVNQMGQRRCTHEVPPVVPEPPSPSPPPTPEEYAQTGVAGALSQMSIGATEASPALDDFMRRQGWEAGNIDYMGADAFDNIWAKISQTLSLAPAPSDPEPQPAPEPTPPPQAAPIPVSAPALITSDSNIPDNRSSTGSFEQISSGITATISDISISKPSSLENSSDSSNSDTSATELKKPSASPKEKEDPGKDQQLPSKPKDKLVCQLKPSAESEPLLTPESELEDAATIAQKIIASEESLSSPIITSATPMSSPPVCPVAQQNVKDLNVKTHLPDTPPLVGPVSLAQIGIVPTKLREENVPKTKEPKSLVQLTESKVITSPELVEETAIPAEYIPSKTSDFPIVQAVSGKPVKKKESKIERLAEAAVTKTDIVETKRDDKSKEVKSETVKEPDSPKTPIEVAPPKTSKLVSEKSVEGKTSDKKGKKVVKQKSSTETPPKTPDAESDGKKLVCSLTTKDKPSKVVAEIELPKDLEQVTLPKTLERAILEPSVEKIEKKSSETKESKAEEPEEISKVDLSAKKEETAEAKSKTKKVVKKVPAPKAESAGSEGPKKTGEVPVPPPRKKVVKPKDKQ